MFDTVVTLGVIGMYVCLMVGVVSIIYIVLALMFI